MLRIFGRGSSGITSVAHRDATLQSLHGYWEAKRVNGALPGRADIDPRGMADHLEKVFLIERVSKGNARFRLAGMQLHDLMGMDVRGMPISTLFTPTARPRMSAEVEAVFDGPAIVELVLESERGIGRPSVSGRMLLLPLTNGGEEIELALGCIVTEGNLGRAPRRFEISGVLHEDLCSPRTQPEVATLKLVATTAPQARMHRPLPKPAPKLRLVVSQS